MNKLNKSKTNIEDILLMSRATSSLKKLSRLEYDRYLEIKAIKDQYKKRKMYNDLLKLMPDKEQELKRYFYPSLADKKNDKFGYLSKGTTFISNGKAHKMRSCGKTLIRSIENKVFKNEDIEGVSIL